MISLKRPEDFTTMFRYYPIENKTFFLYKVFAFAVGLPYHDDYHVDYAQALDRFEKLSLNMRTVRYGFSCLEPNFRSQIDSKTDYVNIVIRISCITTFIRLLVWIFFSEPFLHIYLADPWGHYSLSWAIHAYAMSCLSVIFFLRELFIATESRGVINFWMNLLNELRKDEYSAQKYNFSKRSHINFFYVVSTVTSNSAYRLMVSLTFMLVIFNGFTYYQSPLLLTNRSFFWSTIFWFPTMTITYVSCGTFLMSYTGYCFLLIWSAVLRLHSINFKLKTLLTHVRNNKSREYRFQIRQIMMFLNQLEQLSDGHKWCTFVLVIFLSGISNMTIYAGLIIRSHSEFIADLITFFGSLPFISLCFAIYLCGCVMSMVRNNRIIINIKISIDIKLIYN